LLSYPPPIPPVLTLSVSSRDLFDEQVRASDMASPISVDEQRALLIPIAEIATLSRFVLSIPCRVSENNLSLLVAGEQRLVLGASYFMITVSVSAIVIINHKYKVLISIQLSASIVKCVF
jgi:hypothetical protein